MDHARIVLAALLLLCVGAQAQPGTPQTHYAIEAQDLAIDFSAIAPLAGQQDDGDWSWSGAVSAHRIRIALTNYERAEFDLDEPGAVLNTFIFNRRDDKSRRSLWLFPDAKHVAGPFGFVPYGVIGTAPFEGPEQAGECAVLCGITQDHGYALSVECSPTPTRALRKRIAEFLRTGIQYGGSVRDAAWTDAEARNYWGKYVAPKIRDKLEIRRTAHYIILGNVGGKLFGRKMEECYRKIRKVFPFDEVAGQRRMPVFLFRTEAEYHDFYQRRAEVSREEALGSKGHAWLDYYATWYESPNDPTHIHEATHQIFQNRLILEDGGSWFHEAMAELMAERPSAIKAGVRVMLKYDDHVPLRQFLLLPDLMTADVGGSARVGDTATANYAQAASIALFLYASPFGRKGFQTFVRSMGRVDDTDLDAMEQVFQQIYGVDIAEVEKRWKSYYR